MFSPGAKISILPEVTNLRFKKADTQRVLPKFEKLLLASWMLVAPTVIAEGARAGEKFLLSMLSLPAPSIQERA